MSYDPLSARGSKQCMKPPPPPPLLLERRPPPCCRRYTCTFLLQQGKLPQAEELHRRALKIRQYTLGEDHPSTVASLCHLAVSLRDQGKTHAGDLLLRRAGEIRSASRGKGRVSNRDREAKDGGAKAVELLSVEQQQHQHQQRQLLMTRHSQQYYGRREDGVIAAGMTMAATLRRDPPAADGISVSNSSASE